MLPDIPVPLPPVIVKADIVYPVPATMEFVAGTGILVFTVNPEASEASSLIVSKPVSVK
jgi:hypothetical protein